MLQQLNGSSSNRRYVVAYGFYSFTHTKCLGEIQIQSHQQIVK